MSNDALRRGNQFEAVAIAELGGFQSPQITEKVLAEVEKNAKFREDLEKAERMTGKPLAILQAFRHRKGDDEITRDKLEQERIAEKKTRDKIQAERDRMCGRLNVGTV